MRAPASALLALVALLLLPALASADPSDVYVDYASDGKLDCGHSRPDLEGLLTDASINEYGDPLLLTKLKIAVRRQLAVGCGGGGGGGSSQEAPATQPTLEPAEEPQEASPPETTAAQPTEAAGAEETTVATTAEPETAAAQSATEPATTAAEPAPETASRTEDVTVAAGPTADDDGDSGGGLALLGVLGVAGIAVLAAGGWLARRSLTRG
jgi:hypothetical protein